VVESSPENYSTNFTAEKVEVKFDEYIKLDKLKDKLVISPVMEEKPDIVAKGKMLEIEFNSELLPDRTYTINFGDALVDLNESNPLENYQYVFSTGDKLDSLQMSGHVIDAFTQEPVEKAAVMLYAENHDTLPLTTLPTYLSITNENGEFKLNNLAAGSYKIFALIDANSNFLFDQPTEQVAFLDSLITPTVTPDTTVIPTKAETPTATIALQDTTVIPAKAGTSTDTTTILEVDSIAIPDTIALQDTTVIPAKAGTSTDTTTILEVDTTYLYLPQNLLLHTFVEKRPNQKITETNRPQANKIEIIFNEPLDSLSIQLRYIDSLLNTPDTPFPDSSNLTPQDSSLTLPLVSRLSPLASRLSSLASLFSPSWSPTRDSITLWVNDTTLAARDSLIFVFGFNVYDSLEQKIPTRDTVRFNFRTPKNEEETDKNPFQITSNTKRNKELGVPFMIYTAEPYQTVDTSFIEFVRKQDTIEIDEAFELWPDTMVQFSVSSEIPAFTRTGFSEKPQDSRDKPQDSIHISSLASRLSPLLSPLVSRLSPLSFRLSPLSDFLPDSSYSLRFFPGAFTTYTGLTNDTTKFDFTVKNPDQYGIINLTLEAIDEPAVLQLLNSKGTVVKERHMTTSGRESFYSLKPGKYTFKLILDTNQNGKWDTGRYLKKIQPEGILVFGKELDLKANWEMDETWSLADE